MVSPAVLEKPRRPLFRFTHMHPPISALLTTSRSKSKGTRTSSEGYLWTYPRRLSGNPRNPVNISGSGLAEGKCFPAFLLRIAAAGLKYCESFERTKRIALPTVFLSGELRWKHSALHIEIPKELILLCELKAAIRWRVGITGLPSAQRQGKQGRVVRPMLRTPAFGCRPTGSRIQNSE